MPFLETDTGNIPDFEPVISTFEDLVQDLSAALARSSGLEADEVDPIEIQKLMARYVSDPKEWGSYALADASKTYTRNLIDEGNGKSNLVS